MNVTLPEPGQGWDRLLADPTYNGGYTYPPELAAHLDRVVPFADSVGLTTDDGVPAALFTFQAAGPGEVVVHWCNDGRLPLSASLDLLDEVTRTRPEARFLSFVRRRALVRLLASRGWTLSGEDHGELGYMALMVCQREMSEPTK